MDKQNVLTQKRVVKHWVTPTVTVAKMEMAESHISGTIGDGVFGGGVQGYS